MVGRRVRWFILVAAIAFPVATNTAQIRYREMVTQRGTGVSASQSAEFASGLEIPQAVIDPGEARCVGGEPTGTFPPCSPGTIRVLIHGRTSEFIYANLLGVAAAMFDGPNTVVGDCNLDGSYKGHCWGTFRWEIASAGAWVGNWSGQFDLAANQGFYTAIGHGVEGDLEGRHFTLSAVYTGGTAPGVFVARVSEAE